MIFCGMIFKAIDAGAISCDMTSIVKVQSALSSSIFMEPDYPILHVKMCVTQRLKQSNTTISNNLSSNCPIKYNNNSWIVNI